MTLIMRPYLSALVHWKAYLDTQADKLFVCWKKANTIEMINFITKYGVFFPRDISFSIGIAGALNSASIC